MLLHAARVAIAYHGETLAYGLAPASAAQYHVQRLRWGQGAMQMLRKLNPLFAEGAHLAQRIMYFASVIVYVDGMAEAGVLPRARDVLPVRRAAGAGGQPARFCCGSSRISSSRSVASS